MARKKQDSRNKLGKKTEHKGEGTPLKGLQPGQAEDGTGDATAQPHKPAPRSGTPADQRERRSGPQPSSLNDALYLWLSKKPNSVQNTILVGFAVCALLFFFARIIDVTERLLELLPRNIPSIQGVIRNEYDLDVDFSKTGDFIIQASPLIKGKFDLYPVQDIVTADSNMITVPRKGGEVPVCAKIRNARKVYEYYKDGEYPLTLTLAAGTQRYMAQIDRFSEVGIDKGWLVSIPSNITSERVIKVCFDELSDSSKRSILRDETNLEDLVLLKDETDRFIEELWDKVDSGRFFRMITKEYFNEIVDGKMPHPPSAVLAKIAIGIYESKKGEKIILLEVTDTLGKIKKREAENRSTYYPESQEDMVSNFITFATLAIIKKYPIKGRISDASRDDNIVEMGIGRLTGVRKLMELDVYCGEAVIGYMKITATWPSTCEGTLRLNGTYDPKKTFTSLVVCSTLEE